MLAEQGHAVTVIISDDSVHQRTDIQESAGILLIRFNPRNGRLGQALGYTAQLSYNFAGLVKDLIAEKGRPDIIEAQDYLGIGYYLSQYKHLGYDFMNGIPIVLTLHSPAFIYLEYNRAPIYRFPDYWTCEMERQSIIAADVLISPTRYLAEEIQRHVDISKKTLHLLPNPYNITQDHRSRPFTRNRIVYYGKLSAQKGSFLLLDHFKDLWDDGFDQALHIVGGTDIVYHPEMQTMGQLVEKRFGSYISKGLLRLHGKISPSRIESSLQDAHVILVPSIVDNMPYVVMEAMSLGKIVLASVQGGQQEMIEDGINGFLFDHRSPSAFRLQLEKILRLTDDEILQIGRNAYERVRERYSFRTIAPLKSGILEQAVSSPGDEGAFPFLYQENKGQQPLPAPENNLLSVVIPYYDMGPYIDGALMSIGQSSYDNIEIIIVNDGSRDPLSLEKLDRMRDRAGVTIIHQVNKGLAAARNSGAHQAKGAYLAFLDADDKVSPEYYEKAIRALKKNSNVYFAGSWVQYFENSDKVWPTFTPQPPYALIHNPVNSSGLVYKREAFLRGGLNDKSVDYGLEDYESVVSLLAKGFNGVVLPEILFNYRIRSGSMIRGITREKLIYSYKYITTKHSAYYSKFAAEIIHLLNANGPGYLYDNPTFEVQVTTSRRNKNPLMQKFISFIKRNQRLKRIALHLKKLKNKL